MPARDHQILRNVPNALTLLRLCVVPAFVALFLIERGTTTAIGLLFMAAAFTDFFDGFLARRFDLLSQFGKVADPLADRLLTNSAVILLCAFDDRMLGWEWVLVIARDVGATYGLVRLRRHAVIDVSPAGKVGTALMMAGMAWTLVLPDAVWPLPFFWIGLGISIAALLHYVWKYRWIFRSGNEGSGGAA